MAKIPIVSVYDQDGNRIEVPAIVGRSAYQSAQKLGYTGSEEEWIESLRGKDGRGIKSIVRTEGDGTPGTTDTYTITYTDNESDTFTVHNGIDRAFVEEKFDQISEDIADKTGGSKVYYAICDTPGETNPKMAYTVTKDFVLEKGARVGVWFKYNNIGSQNLNVDDTGTFQWISARKADGSIVSDTPTMYKAGGQTHWFTFDGEYWVVDDSIRAGEDTVGKVTLAEIRTQAAKNHYTKTEVDNKFTALDAAKADKEFVINIFEQLKVLIETGKTDEAIAVLDEAILDLAVLA